MAQVQRVSWRTVGYAALGAIAIIAATVGIVRSDGVRPTSLKSNSATRWLVDQVNHRLVLADGLTGRVLAKIKTESESTDQVAFQGLGGAFLVAPDEGSVRTISTAKLELGAAQRVAALAEPIQVDTSWFGVGANGLTVVNPITDEASLVSVDDTPRPITVPPADSAMVARDGSMWLFAPAKATHVAVDGSTRSFDVTGNRSATATVGTHAVVLDRQAGVVHWLDGADVAVTSIPNVADAILQERRGDDAPCVWLATNDTLACVGKHKVDHTVPVPGLTVNAQDQLAIADGVAVVLHKEGNRVERFDLTAGNLLTADNPDPEEGHELTIVSVNGMVWIDDTDSTVAWVVHRFGVEEINKTDESAPLLNAQGQVEHSGTGPGGQTPGGGNAPGDEDLGDRLDHDNLQDPPVAVADSVTARAGDTVIIPVTANDYDPDGDAIALFSVGDGQKAGHGTTDVLDGSSVVYVPQVGYSGGDSFEYTIVDEIGNTATATVTVELFPADSPNRPPITRDDRVKTRAGHAVTVDVLANDIDPERDLLTIPSFAQTGAGTISETIGPTGLQALRYEPPAGSPGVYTFSYRAADPQGGTSDDTEVTVEVTAADAPNQPPVARPDAIRLHPGSSSTLNVRANDSDPDGDDLSISVESTPRGVVARPVGQQLEITLQPSALPSSVVRYRLSDGEHTAFGRVLVLRIDDDTQNRPPVANPDAERVVVGNSVTVPVLVNDVDPDADTIRLLSVEQPKGGTGTTFAEDDVVRFTPNLPDIDEQTPVSFTYRIGDGHGNTAVGNVTVTVLAEALPRAPLAVDDLAETVTDKPITIDVLANDSDPNGGRPNLLGQPVCPNGGTAQTTPDSRIVFTPPLGRSDGVFRCQYRVANSQGQAEAFIIVTVRPAPPGNHDPEINAAEISKSVQVGSQITFNANLVASDSDGDNLEFASVSKPGVGSTNFTQRAGSFTYFATTGSSSDTPLAVTFDVTITDGHDGNVRTQISLLVFDAPTSPSTPPTTREITRNADVDSTIVVDVISELAGSNPGATLSLVSARADTTSQADVVVNSNGTVSITPHVTGTVSVTYTVQRSEQSRASGKIIVTVTAPPVNDPPIAVDDALVVASGGSGQVDVLANDSGITDPDDVAKATITIRPPTSFATVTLFDGILTMTANPNSPGGTSTVTYSLTDGTGRSDTGVVNVQILACTASPPEARSETVFTPYMTPINIDLTTLVVSGTIVAGSVQGAGLNGPIGTYTPPAGKNDSETVTFDVVNACNQVASGSLTIDVNRAPNAHVTNLNISPGDTLTLLPTDIADDDESLTIVALQGQPGWVTLVVGADGTRILAAPPAGTAGGTYTFTASVEDPGHLSTTATIALTVNNLPPTAVPDAYATTLSLFPFDPTLNDFDAETPTPDLSIQTVSVIDGSGTVQSITGNTVVVSVGHGVSHFSYTIQDGGGLTASSTITVTSNNAPSAPNASGTTSQPSIVIDVFPTDPDGDDMTIDCNLPADPPGFILTVFADTEPGPTVEIPLHFQIPAGALGQFVIPCTVTDTFGATGGFTVTIDVT